MKDSTAAHNDSIVSQGRVLSSYLDAMVEASTFSDHDNEYGSGARSSFLVFLIEGRPSNIKCLTTSLSLAMEWHVVFRPSGKI